MVAGAIAMFAVIVGEGGGFSQIISSITTNYNLNVPPAAQPSVLTIVSLVFMTSFGTWGLPQMTQKYYAIKDEAVIPRAIVVCTIFAAIVGFCAYFVGTTAHAFFTSDTVPRLASGRINFDLIVPTLLTQHLPETLIALILLFVLSASMSTLSSLVLISASSVAIDLYPVKVDAGTSKERSTAMIRFLSFIFIVISYFVSRFQISIIVTLMSLSWGAVSGAFAAPYILSLYSKRVTKAGAYAGLLGGLAIEAILFTLVRLPGPLAASIAIIAPFALVPLVSAFTKAPDKAVLDRAFAAVN
jgi:SSS family solute:Na+ symporter